MALPSEQIEQGRLKRIAGTKSRAMIKKFHHRRLRRLIKSSVNYVAHYNRYKGWEL